MKPKIIVTLLSCGLLLFANKSFSQLFLNENNNDFTYATSLAISTDANEDTNVSNLSIYAGDIKVQRAFILHFGEAAENNWSKIGKNFLNRFHFNGLLTNALFSNDGQLIYVITYGTEKNLPVDVRKIVKPEYYDYTITMAIEVKENNRDIWVIKLDNASEQITVRVEDSEMEQVQQFQKN